MTVKNLAAGIFLLAISLSISAVACRYLTISNPLNINEVHHVIS